jgi:hypothetical protein
LSYSVDRDGKLAQELPANYEDGLGVNSSRPVAIPRLAAERALQTDQDQMKARFQAISGILRWSGDHRRVVGGMLRRGSNAVWTASITNHADLAFTSKR